MIRPLLPLDQAETDPSGSVLRSDDDVLRWAEEVG
jgi:hypothetical protein